MLPPNKDKVKQLQKPACMYFTSSKHQHDFWKTLSTAVGTPLLSVCYLNEEQNGQCSPVLPNTCLALTPL